MQIACERIFARYPQRKNCILSDYDADASRISYDVMWLEQLGRIGLLYSGSVSEGYG